MISLTFAHPLRVTLAAALCVGIFTTDVATAGTDISASTPMLGIGINRLTYWNGGQIMVDLVRESSFSAIDWSANYLPDANGAPGKDFHLALTSRMLGAGVYKLSFNGQAALRVQSVTVDGSNNGGKLLNQIYNSATNTSTADVYFPVAVNNAWINFTNTRRSPASITADGVTNIHLYRPGYPTDDSAFFTNEFISAMGKVQVIRTMDFTATNSNPSVEWSERPTMSWQGYNPTYGQPWELVVQLANATNRDIWINIPVKANDTYITKLAQLIRYGSDGVNPYTQAVSNPVYPGLNSGLRVYFEYGNEIWNGSSGFMGKGWALAFADLYRNDTTHPIAFDGPQADRGVALWRWVAYRSSTASLIFRSVFGDSEMNTTVRPVLATQFGNGSATLTTGLRWADSFYRVARVSPFNETARAVSYFWWGAGGAAYYDSSSQPVDTAAATMTAYFAGLPDANLASKTAIDSTWANAYGLVSAAYEGGPQPGGTATGSATSNKALPAAYSADSRMMDRMIAAHAIYEANGGQFFNYYVYSGNPVWSFQNEVTPNVVSDTNTPKMNALGTIGTTAKTAATLGKLAPAIIDLRDATASIQVAADGNTTWAYGGAAQRLSTKGDPGRAETILVPVRSNEAATYSLALDTFDAPAGGLVELLVNGKSVGTIALVASNSGTAVRSPSISYALSAGLNVVRLRSLAGTIWVKNLVLQ